MTATKSNYELAQEAKKRDPGNYQDGQKYRVWKYDGAAPQPVQVEMVFVAAKNWFYEEETDMACKVGGNSFIAAEPIDA